MEELVDVSIFAMLIHIIRWLANLRHTLPTSMPLISQIAKSMMIIGMMSRYQDYL